MNPGSTADFERADDGARIINFVKVFRIHVRLLCVLCDFNPCCSRRIVFFFTIFLYDTYTMFFEFVSVIFSAAKKKREKKQKETLFCGFLCKRALVAL